MVAGIPRGGSGQLLLFLGELWMLAGISWWAMDGGCDFLVGSGWLLLVLVALKNQEGMH